ncbi:sigma factor [Paenibacillus sp. FSL K6-1566]|uniref:sigma factor n=1 Tax=Paenibacillus sp. FSL K6-1566 TaxID=2954515 RepID=UPI003101850A
MAFDSEFSSLITPFVPLLRRYCLQLASGSSWDAEELLQESLIKLHRSLSRSQDRPIPRRIYTRSPAASGSTAIASSAVRPCSLETTYRKENTRRTVSLSGRRSN